MIAVKEKGNILSDSPSGNVLVVDDNGAIVQFFSAVLKEKGYTVFTALDEKNAEILFRNEVFDFAITDIYLKQYDGIELVKKFKDIQPLTPVIVMSGMPSLQLAINALRAGAYDFVIKPLDIQTINNLAEKATQFKINLIKKEIEKKRLEYIAESANLMENIGFVFSGVRHELGNPINAIKITLSVLRDNIDNFDKKMILDFVERGLADIKRVEYLLKSLKNFSMFENSSPEKVHIRRFMDDFTKLVIDDLKRRGISYVMEIHDNCRMIHMDPRLLQHILLNLVTNAAAALEKIKDEPKLKIIVSPADKNIKIQVIDNGCGISKENMGKLFQPFFSTKPDGTGLGLVIVKKMLVLSGGTIQVNSKENVGTEITLLIPKAPSSLSH